MSYEQKVREFYEHAGDCYQSIMGDSWHHGDPAAEARGLSPDEARRLLEEQVVALSELKPGGRAMDFGSGVGGPMLYMAKISGATWVGISNTDRLNQKARARAVELGLADRVSFLTTGDDDYKTMLPFADGSFDAVTFYESVCHVPDKAAFFRAAFRILRPGGWIVGIDWLQRPFGEHQTEEQIMRLMQPVNDTICIPWHGTVGGYESMLKEAGFRVTVAKDMFDGIKCWGTTPDEERSHWLNYSGSEAEQFHAGKVALDNARAAGVFTVGMFAATKPD